MDNNTTLPLEWQEEISKKAESLFPLSNIKADGEAQRKHDELMMGKRRVYMFAATEYAIKAFKAEQENAALKAKAEKLFTEKHLIAFYDWMGQQGWRQHDGNGRGRYFYRSKDQHLWPPEETCEEDELLKKWNEGKEGGVSE